ncbi:substrate-binding domain-containing protein [Emticicia sp. CRIBPO]|nr:substrate-binding domain-containing protein [Emticicia sp. CRIBPO]
MQKCTKCHQVDGVIKAGFIRGNQRFFCKICSQHFILENAFKSDLKKNGQSTITDVANALGVSISTVSRALNDKSDINPDTKKAILQAAMELDYRPNLLAQSLHKGKTNTIGVIIPDVEHPFFAKVLAGIQQVANSSCFRIIVCHSNESKSAEILNTETLIDCRVDGLIISHSKETTSFEHIKKIIDKGIPVVQFDRIITELNTHNVMHQDYKGSFDLVEHLILQGCERIAIMSGPQEMYICKQRLEGYKAAFQKYGREINEEYIVHSNIAKKDCLDVFDYFMSLEYPPDGIFTILNRNGVEMMKIAKERGIRIPQEIAFAGFGDDILAEYFEPSLTVFNHFPPAIGQEVMKVLIRLIENKTHFPAYNHFIEGELVVRQSSQKGGYIK